MRLIDADALIDKLPKEYFGSTIHLLINDAPTVSAEAVPQSDQYKRGFEDAKRAFLLEYARESENMRKRNAKLEVMLNAQKATSAEAEWIPCSERLPNDAKDVLVCMRNGWIYMASYRHNRRLWKIDANGYANCEIVIAWMPLPKPYRKDDET